QRIAMQLEMDIPNNKKVDYYRTWYLKHPNHLYTVSKRAAPFLYMITQRIEERGLPMELALLPVVESSFDAFAYSHGSAAGLWQFVPGTGKMMGLEQNYWYDGRRDVAASTDAALDYLVQLNERFDGNWEHAIAAYNSGGGRVSSAIRKNKKLGKPVDFFSLDLPKETSSYVPKLLALADVVANQEKYGIDIPSIPNKPVLTLVDPKEQLDLA
ncbi:transglycosylase SLT domain-containing protein, partial [Vibrio sp. 2033]